MAFLAPLAAPLLEVGGAEAAGAAAGGAEGGLMSSGLGGFMGDHPFLMGNLMGRAMSGGGPAGQAMMGPSAGASVAPAGVTGRHGAFGDDNVEFATDNRGENSSPEDHSSTGIEGPAEHGDSPEQLKDIGGAATAPNVADDLSNQDGADSDLRNTATNAFHSNLPLVLEFAFSEESGENHPILTALDELLESAFPGYKDADPLLADGEDTTETGVGPDDAENPTEKLEKDLGQDLDEDGPADTPEDEEREKVARVAAYFEPGQWVESRDPRDMGIGPMQITESPIAHMSGPVAKVWHPELGEQYRMHKLLRPTDNPMDSVAREAGYCPECWGDLDVFKRCASCKTATDPMHMRPSEMPRCPGCGERPVEHGPGGECPDGSGTYDSPAVPNKAPLDYPTQDRRVFKGPISHRRQADVPAAVSQGQAMDPSAATNITGIPTCPLCGQNHIAGTPCPTAAAQTPTAMPQAPAGSYMTPAMQTNKVVTHSVFSEFNYDEFLRRACPSCGRDDAVGHSGYQEYSDIPIMECGHCGAAWDGRDPEGTVTDNPRNFLSEDEGRTFHDKYAEPGEGFDSDNFYHSKTAEFDDHELDQEPDPMHNESYEDGETPDTGWYEDWKGPDQEKHPWVDEHGEPLQEGGTYDMHSTGYEIPDKIKVLAVTPNKLSYELEAGDIAYKDTITTDDVYKSGYSFKQAPVDDDPGMETQQPVQRQPLDLEHPKPPRPGDDALPQQDDLSSPPTKVSNEKGYLYPGACEFCGDDTYGVHHTVNGDVCPTCAGNPGAGHNNPNVVERRDNAFEPDVTSNEGGRDESYYGSFQGDMPDSRNWLNDPGPGQGVDLDPHTMEKIAAKDFSAREQRQFIDESGEARNLHRLDLEGTHYELDDLYGDALW